MFLWVGILVFFTFSPPPLCVCVWGGGVSSLCVRASLGFVISDGMSFAVSTGYSSGKCCSAAEKGECSYGGKGKKRSTDANQAFMQRGS